jgi:methyl-accepting chemotaxis protein
MESIPTHDQVTARSRMDTPWEGAPTGAPSPRRRRFLVDSRYQLRASLLSVTVVLILLFLLNMSLYSLNSRSTAIGLAIAPELRSYLLSQSRSELNLVLVGSAIFLLGTFVVGILESHRTAGAAYKIARSLSRVRDGSFSASLRLRRSDELQEVARAFNAMATSLQERTHREIEALEGVLARVERFSADPSTPGVVDDLRGLLDEKRRLLDSRNS